MCLRRPHTSHPRTRTPPPPHSFHPSTIYHPSPTSAINTLVIHFLLKTIITIISHTPHESHKMRSRIFSLSRGSIRTSSRGHRPPSAVSTAEKQPMRYVHCNTTRSAVAVQCASMAMNNIVVEGSLCRGWDAGVALDDDDGG